MVANKKTIVGVFSSILFLVLLQNPTPTAAGKASAKEADYDHGHALTKWLTNPKHGGKIHPALQLERSFPGAPFYGIVATADIKQDDLLLEIPRHLLVTPDLDRVDEGSDDDEVDIYKVGDRVEAVYEDDSGNMFFGTVIAVHEFDYDGEDAEEGDLVYEYDVQYDDGDIETGKDASMIFRIDDCATVQRLLEEVQQSSAGGGKKGKKKKAAPSSSNLIPYLDYLLSQPEGQLPAAWSEAGQALLNDVFGANPGITIPSRTAGVDPNTTTFATTATRPKFPPLPPDMSEAAYLSEEFVQRCQGGKPTEDTPVLLNFYHLLMQRGWDEVMIPVFDMMSHGNGRLLNTFHPSIRVTAEDGTFLGMKEDPVQVFAARDIPKGEELYTTYNMCADCQNRFMGYGTPELLRDYGFVEGFPQRWFFEWPVPEGRPPIEVGFELDHKDLTKPDNGEYELTWLTPKLSHPTMIRYFRWHIRRLEGLAKTILSKPCPEDIPAHEYQTILRFQEAMMLALMEGLKAAGRGITEEEDADCQGETDTDSGFCAPPQIDSVYDSLEPVEMDWIDNRPDTCNEGENSERSPFYTNEFEFVERIQSPYQLIEFTLNKSRNNDSCFQLDGVTQICTSYRPDYHEMVVHNTARYLETDLKRVAFVGGGDSMLLHDILKYPTLEKVIGLEIDQFVTRGSFKHFGTQPHWDQHEKVEWWFGDATKTLPMLPKDYFGSFDMVLVDLSETVASMSVTDDLNIMEALSLLLQPRGILVKNEYMYFDEQAHIYKEAMHIHWYTLPYVCSQSLIMASNAVDFMRTGYNKRDVDHILPLLDKPDIQYGYLHDYQKNYGHSKYCLDMNGDKFVEPENQEQSPGVMMIIEAENAKDKSLTTDALKKLTEKTLKKQGFSVVSSMTPKVDDGTVVTILKEGYVVARAFPEDSYCAFDFQLWGKFPKQQDAKKALIEAVGSKVHGGDSSSYRIVSGGMFGIESWKEDQKKRGPKIVKCDEDTEPPVKYDQPSDLTTTLTATSESLSFVVDSDFTVLVLCGADSDCKTADEVKKAESPASNIIVLKPCPGITEEGFDFLPDAMKRLSNCEIEVWNTLEEEISQSGQRIRSIIVDPSAPQSLAQLCLKIFTSPVNRKRFLTPYMMVAAPAYDIEETWREVFADKFRTDVFPVDPTFRSDLYFNNTADGTSFMIALASSGDKDFGEKLVVYADKMEKESGVTVEIRNVRGNTFEGFQVLDPIDTSKNFTDAHFDQTDGLKQWYGQTPMGFQVLFQFELQSRDTTQKTSKAFKSTIISNFVAADDMEYKVFSDLGSGDLVVAVWAEGSAIFVYDGRSHCDVNLFLYEEDFQAMNKFEKDFVGRVTGMTRTLRDTQPRGTGHVINFARDLESDEEEEEASRPTPKWEPSS